MLTLLARLSTCLTACMPLRLAAASELVQVALHFLNFEGRHLFMSMSQLQLSQVEKFFDLSPEVAKKVLAPMEASLKQSDELAKYMRFCQQIIHTSTNATDLKVPLSPLHACRLQAAASYGRLHKCVFGKHLLRPVARSRNGCSLHFGTVAQATRDGLRCQHYS